MKKLSAKTIEVNQRVKEERARNTRLHEIQEMKYRKLIREYNEICDEEGVMHKVKIKTFVSDNMFYPCNIDIEMSHRFIIINFNGIELFCVGIPYRSKMYCIIVKEEDYFCECCNTRIELKINRFFAINEYSTIINLDDEQDPIIRSMLIDMVE